MSDNPVSCTPPIANNTDQLPSKVAECLNAAEIGDPYYPSDARGVLDRFVSEHDNLTDAQRTLIGNFSNLFLFQRDDRHKTNPRKFQRFCSIAGQPSEIEVWVFAWDVADGLKHPVFGPYLDDLLLENVAKLRGHAKDGFRNHFTRTISRYIEQATFLEGHPEWRENTLLDLALTDALDRAVQLSEKFGQPDSMKCTIEILRRIAERYHREHAWRWLLPVVETYVRAAKYRRIADLIPDDELIKVRSWAEEAAAAASNPEGIFNLIEPFNEMAGRIGEILGENDPFALPRKRTADLISKVAQRRAESGENVAASIIIDEAISQAKRVGDENLAEELSQRKSVYIRNARESGEFKQVEGRIPIEKDDWDRFVEPFRKTPDLNAGLELFIRHPSFIPNYRNLRKELHEAGFSIAWLGKTSIVNNMDLQVAGDGTEQTSADLDVKGRMCMHVKLNAAFMNEVFGLLVAERGLSPDVVMQSFEKWTLMSSEKLPILRCGVERHFKGEFIDSIHILACQFEAILRNAFHLAGYPDTIETTFSAGKGVSQSIRTLGSFLRRDDIGKALTDRLRDHFEFVFSDSLGLNLRNQIAHGLMPVEGFTAPISCLTLHSLLLLTCLKTEEKE
jgi:hypothetical protein